MYIFLSPNPRRRRLLLLYQRSIRIRYAGVFDTLDSNNDGVIDEMELNDVILSMYQARTAHPTQSRADPFTPT